MSDRFDEFSSESVGSEKLHKSTKRPIVLATLTVGLIAIALVGVLATRPSASNISISSPLVGKLAPAINGVNINGGGSVSLDSLRGKFVIINFFASWCTPCQLEAPELESFYYEHSKIGDVQIIGVTFDDTSNAAASFLRSTGGTWGAVEDSSGSVALAYGVSEPPETFLVSPQGFVIAKFIGQVSSKGLESSLNSFKKGQ